jgi:hypothetical protein
MRLYPRTDNFLRPWLAALAMFLPAAGLLTPVFAAGGAPVVVMQAETREMTPLIQVAGTVISRNDSRLAAQVAGQVTWVAEVGTSLATGDVAARLDDVLIRDVLVEEQARLAREQANVKFNKAEAQRLAKLAKDNHAAISLSRHRLSVLSPNSLSRQGSGLIPVPPSSGWLIRLRWKRKPGSR